VPPFHLALELESANLLVNYSSKFISFFGGYKKPKILNPVPS